jgi:hypothetical protein
MAGAHTEIAMNQGPLPPDDRHFSNPEIIPPGRPDRDRLSGMTWTRLVIDEDGVPRVFVTRIGPLGRFVAWLVAVLVVLALVVFFLGAFVFLMPLIVVLLAVGVGMSIWSFVIRQRF